MGGQSKESLKKEPIFEKYLSMLQDKAFSARAARIKTTSDIIINFDSQTMLYSAISKIKQLSSIKESPYTSITIKLL